MIHISRATFMVYALCLIVAGGSIATSAAAKTDLKLPRFVAVKTDEANVRAGPGVRYQIKWVIKRPDLPVEVIAEFEQWRKIRDIQGDEGWMHRSMLTNRRTVLVTGENQFLRRDAEADANAVAQVEVNVEGRLLDCERNFCKVQMDKHTGWIDRKFLWGVYPYEYLE